MDRRKTDGHDRDRMTVLRAAPSPNFNDRPDGRRPDMLVFHYTGMISGQAALARLCDPEAQVSAHYTVDEDGTIYAHVAEEKRAWHAGVARWQGTRDINGRSIGIEIVNPGHEFGYRPFPSEQIASVRHLAKDILARHQIPPHHIVGHSDVAPDRKQDPGELFPWQDFAAAGIGLWPRAVAISFRDDKDQDRDQIVTQLQQIGYGAGDPFSLPDVLAAFQRRFRPRQIDGMLDPETGALIQALAKQVHLLSNTQSSS